jgi:hypothetical protein
MVARAYFDGSPPHLNESLQTSGLCAPNLQQLSGELRTFRNRGNVQAAETRAKAAWINSGSGAHCEEIVFIAKQKVLGFVASSEAVTLQVFESLRENRDPEFLLRNWSFGFFPSHD